MARLIEIREDAHWYTLDGEPRHDADLRRARKEGLLPSRTTVGWVTDKPFLTRYRQEQMLIAALTTERLDDEPINEWAARIVEVADEESRAGRERGKRCHAAIESWLKDEVDVDDLRELEDWPVLLPAVHWIEKHVVYVVASEQTLASQVHGYGGTVDALVRLRKSDRGERFGVLDFKWRKKAAKYDDDCKQLAAYRELVLENGILPAGDDCISLVCGTEEPEILVHPWSETDLAWGWQGHLLELALWRHEKRFPYERG